MSHDDADKRIEEMELELARRQAETTPRQIDANLVRESLKATLTTASVFASTVVGIINDLGDGFGASVDQMANDLNGSKRGE